ncbi:MAG: NAD-dependent epimerase/dehydratase family protein [Planctomycetaceae bacterium]
MATGRIVVTGGAGFVGSALALGLRTQRASQVLAFDNLRRRGSELNLQRLRDAGVEFVHGDIRNPEDLERLGNFDLLIDCSAEPSVHAGAHGSPREVLHINLLGTINCLEAARRHDASFLFLSTSRVYPMERLNRLPFRETATRFEWTGDSTTAAHGVAEDFPLSGARSFYGASKLASELLITEYHQTCGVPALINRCGVIAGPWQMGKTDQGVVSLWVASHEFGRPLNYLGFGGQGKQVRDLLHVDDLLQLVFCQLDQPDKWNAATFNVGGGRLCSASLLELTELCRTITARRIEIGSRPDTNPLDVRIYLSDTRRVESEFRWRPVHSVETIVEDTHTWMQRNAESLKGVLT